METKVLKLPSMPASIPYTDLKIIKEQVFDKCRFTLINLKLSEESLEYSACSFTLNGKVVEYRISKITPKKSGQFVTIWKRNKVGITTPFDVSDKLDFIMITSKNQDQLGLFIFPKAVLLERGIISTTSKKGKRGMRVYPPWDQVSNRQAENTQKWQADWFLNLDKNMPQNIILITRILGDQTAKLCD